MNILFNSLILLSILLSSNSLYSETYQEINNFGNLFFEDKEFEINNEFIKIIIPKEYIIYNIEATLKGESEFLYTMNKDLLLNNIKNEDLLKAKEKIFYPNDEISKNVLNNNNNNTLYLLIKEPEKNKVTLKLKRITLHYESLLNSISQNDCEIIKENLKKLIEEAYIFLDYAKNPKQPDGFPDYFKKVDFITDINNINTYNREILYFYRDIREALGKFQDLHLDIRYNGYENYFACLPFSFYIAKNSYFDEAKLSIKSNVCYNSFPESIKKDLQPLFGKFLVSINGTNPFDYIQNFGKIYSRTKNRHATFTKNINTASYFYYGEIPLTQEEYSNIKFVFEGGDSITLSYMLFMLSDNSFTKEFNSFHKEELRKKKNHIILPTLFDIEKKFLLSKNIINEKVEKDEKNKLNAKSWDIEFKDKDSEIKFKCRIDKTNQFNVFVQTDLDFENEDGAYEFMFNCAELFTKNDYPIIVIQSRNTGGSGKHAVYLVELLQTFIEYKLYLSYKPNQIIYDYTGIDPVKTDTCKPISFKDDKSTVTDIYDGGIKHIRTPIYMMIGEDERKKFEKKRNELLSKHAPRKPTDILIFTDGFCFSACSLFMKGMQKAGGAIIAGYMGNPNIKGEDEFDASQSPSQVNQLINSEYYRILYSKYFDIIGVTIGETFLNPYEKNQIPMEYQLNPVDERTDIYHAYSDDTYDDFIEEGKLLFNTYKYSCNSKNKKLTLFTDDCKSFLQKYDAYGGYECNSNDGWSNKCIPIYCDYKYFYDDYKKECIKDKCLRGQKNDINSIILFLSIILILI